MSYQTAKTIEIPLDRLRELLIYDPESGLLTWTEAAGKRRAGNVAGFNQKGYVRVQIDGKNLSAHRLAWYMHYGKQPEMYIDHINHVTNDNRIENLRDVSSELNAWHKSILSDGYRGVRIDKSGRYISNVNHKNKLYYLGTFDTPEEAARRYDIEILKLRGEYAVLNFPDEHIGYVADEKLGQCEDMVDMRKYQNEHFFGYDYLRQCKKLAKVKTDGAQYCTFHAEKRGLSLLPSQHNESE